MWWIRLRMGGISSKSDYMAKKNGGEGISDASVSLEVKSVFAEDMGGGNDNEQEVMSTRR